MSRFGAVVAEIEIVMGLKHFADLRVCVAGGGAVAVDKLALEILWHGPSSGMSLYFPS